MTTRLQNFLTDIIDADLAAGRVKQVVTRFPPEPNGFLHIGHAKSIVLNFGLAKQYGGRTHLRFDDTNPVTEETLYVDGIQADVRWLGVDWGNDLFYASDFFDRMHACAVKLIESGLAYVDTQDQEAIRAQRGDFDRPGTHSPFRDRPKAENLALFADMRDGKFKDGEAVLRAKIDMSHPNVLMRDPLLYRIRHAHHHRTADTWCIYPMYDFAHPLEDAFEGITHSICTLEFETNRPLYDWVLDHTGPWEPRPHQYEFARLKLSYTVMSKRKLLQLVNEKRVSGWDDPRMPTLAGMRRRGVTPEALRAFNERIGVAKNNSLVDLGKLEHAIRSDLETRTPRAYAVLDPLPLTLTDWPAEKVESLEIPWWPADPSKGSRTIPFGAELLIDRADFAEVPPKGWKRLAPGASVRLLGAYAVVCDEVVKDGEGKVVALRGHTTAAPGDGQKTAGNIHWVHQSAPAATVRVYDRLFSVEEPDGEPDFLQVLNPSSLQVVSDARIEPALAQAKPGERFQFLRTGYFIADATDSKPGAPVFNRTITLKDTWAKPAEPPERAAKKPALAGPTRSREDVRAEFHAAHPDVAALFTLNMGLGLGPDEADTLSADPALARFFGEALAVHGNPKSVAKWMVNELLGVKKPLAELPFDGRRFGDLVALVDAGTITASAGKVVLAKLVADGGDPSAMVKSLGLGKMRDVSAISAAVDAVFEAHAAEVARYKAGEKKLLGVLIGAVMKQAAGADAGQVRAMLTQRLG